MVKRVYLVFKTHLDIGFTDLGDTIVEKYLHFFIPNAIARAYELKDTDTPYVWTTGSWLIYQALKEDDGTLDKAIRDTLPVVTQEIGDTWSQNVGTDPQKVSRYKTLLRHIAQNGIHTDLSDSLLVVP